jgi:hypothetical protein
MEGRASLRPDHGRRTFRQDRQREEQSRGEEHLPRSQQRRCSKSVGSDEDNHDCPGRSRRNEHRIRPKAACATSMDGRCRYRTYAQHTECQSEHGSWGDAFLQPPRCERNHPYGSGKRQYRGAPRRQSRQRDPGQCRVHGHLKCGGHGNERPIGSWWKDESAARAHNSEKAKSCNRVAQASIPNGRHCRNADFDNGPRRSPDHD